MNEPDDTAQTAAKASGEEKSSAPSKEAAGVDGTVEQKHLKNQ